MCELRSLDVAITLTFLFPHGIFFCQFPIRQLVVDMPIIGTDIRNPLFAVLLLRFLYGTIADSQKVVHPLVSLKL